MLRIYYDAWHLSHIFGDTDVEAFHGLGYAQMMDFPVTTLLNLWVGTGEYAKAVGRDANSRAKDVNALRWDIPAIAKEQEKAMESLPSQKEFRSYLRAFVSGIEAGRRWWRERPGMIRRLPYHHTTWSDLAANPATGAPPLDEFTLRHLFEDGAGAPPGESMEIEVRNVLCLELLRNRPGAVQSIIQASNAWLVGKSARATDEVVALTDVHVQVNDLFGKGFFTQVYGSSYRAAGWAFAGSPYVALGFNRRLAWSMTAIPQPTPAVTSTWYAKYREPTKKTIVVDGVDQDLVVEKHPWKYWDPVEKRVMTAAAGARLGIETAFVPVEPGFSLGPKRRYPVVPSVQQALPKDLPPFDILFQQTSASTAGRDSSGSYVNSGSLAEFFIQLGRATHVGSGPGGTDEVFALDILAIGSGQNTLVADVDGSLQYVRLSRVPRQGPKVSLTEVDSEGRYAWQKPMDGSDSGYRWTGFHGAADLPHSTLAPGAALPREQPVWINCNVTPNLVVPSDLSTQMYPSYIWNGKTVNSWRQKRARSLFTPTVAGTVWTPLESETRAADQFDQRSQDLFGWFSKVAELSGSPDAKEFIDLLQDLASQDEGAHLFPMFDADRLSQTIPYFELLLGHYERELKRIDPQGKAPKLGFDPDLLPAPPPSPIALGELFGPNYAAMRNALEIVATKWFFFVPPSGSGHNTKLFNHALPGYTFAGSPTPQPWSAFPPDWQNGVVRWGHANMVVLTPLFLPPIGASEPGGTETFAIYFKAAFCVYPPFPLKNHVKVFPIGGTRDTLLAVYSAKYLAYSSPVLLGSSDGSGFVPEAVTDPKLAVGYDDYADAVHLHDGPLPTPRTGTGAVAHSTVPVHYFFVPHQTGSRTVLVTTLRSESAGGPSARFLALMGATEVTAPIDDFVATMPAGAPLGNPEKHHAPTQNFVDRRWKTFEVRERALAADPATRRLDVPIT